MPKKEYSPNEHKGRKDRSLILCVGSLLLFLLAIGIIFLTIWAVQRERHKAVEGKTSAEKWRHNETNQEMSSVNTTLPDPNAEGGEIPTGVTWRLGNGNVNGDKAAVPTVPGGSSRQPPQLECPATPACTEPDPLCKNRNCKLAASRIFALMNPDADPCQDMHEFACGGLQDNHMLQDLRLDELVLDKLIDQIKGIDSRATQDKRIWVGFYRSCLELDRVPRKSRLETVKSLLPSVKNLEQDLTKVVANLILLDKPLLFEVDVQVDTEENNSSFILAILPPAPPTAGMCRDELARGKACGMNDLPEYLKVVKEALTELGLSTYSAFLNDDIGFLYNATPTPAEVSQAVSSGTFFVSTVQDLQQRHKCIAWEQLFKHLTNKPVTEVRMYMNEYFEKLCGFVKTRQFIQGSLIAMFAQQLHSKYLDFGTGSEPRSCMALTANLLPDITSAVYLDSFSSQELKKTSDLISSTYNKIKEVAKTGWENSCFDEASKRILLEKLSSVKIVSDGGSSVFFNMTFQLKNYSNHIQAALQYRMRNRQFRYDRLDCDPRLPQNIWTQVLWPYYNSVKLIRELNVIVVPYGLFSVKPFEDLPDYLYLADLGTSIARSLAQVFDPIGIHFDSRGKFYESVIPGFESGLQTYEDAFGLLKFSFSFLRSQSVRDAFVNYTITSPTILSDKFCDDTAIHLTFEAANASQNWSHLPYFTLTPQQIFFTATAQKFCRKSPMTDYRKYIKDEAPLPPFIRLDAAMTNRRAFAEAFNCSSAPLPDIFECDRN